MKGCFKKQWAQHSKGTRKGMPLPYTRLRRFVPMGGASLCFAKIEIDIVGELILYAHFSSGNMSNRCSQWQCATMIKI